MDHAGIMAIRINMHFNYQSGTSLTEIMVALFIFATALVGSASLHLKSLRTTHFAYEHSLATLQLSNLAERFRANQNANKRKNEFQTWQQQTTVLLGKSDTNYACQTSQCKLTLIWQHQTPTQIVLNVTI